LGKETKPTKDAKPATTGDSSKTPASFQIPEGLLSKDVYERLCTVFAPGAAYWRESDYETRGYYSYFMDKLPLDQAPANLFERVMNEDLLPLAENSREKRRPPNSVLSYGWCTRDPSTPISDTTSISTRTKHCCRKRARSLDLLSSVLYLTVGEQDEATIVLN
jgi:hypothetical protein